MIMLNITDIRELMKKLLYENETAFDAFLLSEAVIKMSVSFSIDGHINNDFYSAEEISELKRQAIENGQEYDEKMVRWKLVKPQVLSIIKGHKTPHSFSIIFYLSRENAAKFISSLDLPSGVITPSSFMLSLKYDGHLLYAVTGTVYPSFTLDKSIDLAWDKLVKKFFNSHSIAFEELI